MSEAGDTTNNEPTGGASTSGRPVARRVPGQLLACGWCGGPVVVKARGRTPKWCSDACRHRAWEQSRAAASGQAAVRVVDRTVEREVQVEKRVQVIKTVEVQVPARPRGAGWVEQLAELVRQLDTGRLYDRDLRAVATAAAELNTALDRRLRHSTRW